MEMISDIWESVCAVIRRSGLSQAAFEVWIRPIEPRSIEDGEMVLIVNTEFQKNTLEDMFGEKLKDAFREVLGFPLGLRILTKNAALETPSPAPATPVEGIGLPQAADGEEYSFDNFVVGPSNKFAHAASLSVANKPGGMYNPLFIHGGSGLGKTHLLSAICKEIKKNNPAARIMYIKGDTMTNELVEAIQTNSTVEFHAKYRQVDVLLVDDIQFLSGKTATQIEFFHTFDALHSAGKQIVLTSDRPPKEIATLEERLRSRFEMGLLADIGAPDLETRIAIVLRKAMALDIPLSNVVADYTANQIKSNVRQLEGVVKRMRAQYLLGGEAPTLVTAQNAIRDIRNDNQPVPLTVERIISEVARTMGVRAEDIRSGKRSAPISRARQVAAYAVRHITSLPMENIGDEFGGRDHSSIVYAIQTVEKKMETDPTFKHLVNDIIKNLSDS